jgi:hypothetical protein
MLLITKDRFREPTMLMKTHDLVLICHDVYENKGVRDKVLGARVRGLGARFRFRVRVQAHLSFESSEAN